MDTEKDAGRKRPPRRAGRRPGLERIPLPALPAHRAGPAPRPRPDDPAPPDPSGSLSAEETDLLLDGLERPPAAPGAPRTGAPGAVIINDLVEEIERDLERDLARHLPDAALPAYSETTASWLPPRPGPRDGGTAGPDETEGR